METRNDITNTTLTRVTTDEGRSAEWEALTCDVIGGGGFGYGRRRD